MDERFWSRVADREELAMADSESPMIFEQRALKHLARERFQEMVN